MLHIKKILCPTDFTSCSDHALNQALHLAERFQAELHLLHVISADQKQETEAASIQQVIPRHIKFVYKRMRQFPVEKTIISYAKDNSIDLILLGTNERCDKVELYLGSIAEKVVNQAPCPVMTMQGSHKNITFESINNILVPVNFSSYAHKTLLYAQQIAGAYCAHLHVLHVIENTIDPAFHTCEKVSVYDSSFDIEFKVRERLQHMLRETGVPEMPYTLHICEGYTPYVISEIAETQKTDLVTIATQGTKGIAHFLNGSIAEKIIRTVRCPVLTVRSSLFPPLSRQTAPSKTYTYI